MTLNTEKEEIAGVINRLANALGTTISSQTGRYGAQLRHQIGQLRSDYATWWSEDTFMAHLLACFTTAQKAPVTLDALAVVRQAMFNEAPVGDISKEIVHAAVTFCLSTEAALVTKLEFSSRDDVENMMRRMRTAFDTARELAADASDSTNYQALTALAGSVMAYLADAARPLPRMVTFRLARTLPALTASQRLYYDPNRWEELVAENKTYHPAFMQRELRGLSE